MSTNDPKIPERLRAVGATNLERRMVEAASREQPSRELSERMARAIGISLPSEGAGGGSDVGTGAGAQTVSGSALPWLAGTFVTAAVAVGVVFAMRAGSTAPAELRAAAPSSPAVAPVVVPHATTSALNPPVAPPAPPGLAALPAPPPSSPSRSVGAAGADLTEQIALLDAARGAVGRGEAERALGLVRKYQTQYQSGAFRPEASAIRIDALMKLGRTSEARSLAERFAATYGAGPLADRVARSVGLVRP